MSRRGGARRVSLNGVLASSGRTDPFILRRESAPRCRKTSPISNRTCRCDALDAPRLLHTSRADPGNEPNTFRHDRDLTTSPPLNGLLGRQEGLRPRAAIRLGDALERYRTIDQPWHIYRRSTRSGSTHPIRQKEPGHDPPRRSPSTTKPQQGPKQVRARS